MKHLRILTITIIILGVIFGIWRFTIDKKSTLIKQTDNQSDIQYYQHGNIYLAIFSQAFELDFTAENTQPLDLQAKSKDFQLAINANYFQGSYEKAQPAGFLQINGENIQTPAPDQQLTHVVIYNQETQQMEFMEYQQFKPENYPEKKYILFQSGPLVIANNEIASQFIEASINGEGSYLRTLIGFTDDGRTLILITTQRYKLADLAAKILTFPELHNLRISLINLDGGPSTAMYSRNFPGFNFNENQGLPLIIGVK
ncbi:MAG: phosphodiester glycosidase family protein [bacterium]